MNVNTHISDVPLICCMSATVRGIPSTGVGVDVPGRAHTRRNGVARSPARDGVVDGLEVSVHTVPTDAPEADGTLTWTSTTMVLVRVRSGEHAGTGWTYGPPACAAVVHDRLADVVLGADALDVGRAFGAMVAAVRNDSRPGVAGYAISAIDVALWDLKARLVGLPLHRLL